MGGNNLENRSLLGELACFDKGGYFDLGHPLLNRIAESFFKAAGIGAVQAVSREAYFTTVESASGDTGGFPPEVSGAKSHHKFPDLKRRRALERNLYNGFLLRGMALKFDNDAFPAYEGLAAGMYSGLTYGLKEARGVHDWKNRALAGAITGAALALTSEDHSHEQLVQCAITGAAISTAAKLLTGVF
ncbi:Outer envelope pore protein 16-2 [Abeliophyllum distichum]|uniref:Outer envelope pore protein 16-2 n=1 Tax=Abeliophyllum distichum TaxID=126358 RepID=A0ABD1VDK4_9LAMI